MKKVYVQPQAEIIALNSLEDFLTTSFDNEMENSKGEVAPGNSPGIY
ncbi:MAG: hypothetical protein IIX54_06235 [Clostridia bacterium]|nr:hypothetical protein [Clostridia bacterium]